MANYNISLKNSTVPYDYATKISPILNDYEETSEKERTKAEERYLLDRALLYLIESTGEDALINEYNKYMDDFTAFYDSFNLGWDSSFYKKAFDLNDLYVKNINPIKELIDKKNKGIQELLNLKVNNPNLIFDVDYRDLKVSDMIENPSITYNVIDGNKLTSDAYDLIKSISNAVYTNNLNGLDDGTKKFIENYQSLGYNADLIIGFILNPDTAPKALQEGLEYIKNTATKGNLLFDSDLMLDYINKGLLLGVGDAKKEYINNPAYGTRSENTSLKEQLETETAILNKKIAVLKLKKELQKHNGSENKNIKGVDYMDHGIDNSQHSIIIKYDDGTSENTQYYNDLQAADFYNFYIKGLDLSLEEMLKHESAMLEPIGGVLDNVWFNQNEEEKTRKSWMSANGNHIDLFNEDALDETKDLDDNDVNNLEQVIKIISNTICDKDIKYFLEFRIENKNGINRFVDIDSEKLYIKYKYNSKLREIKNLLEKLMEGKNANINSYMDGIITTLAKETYNDLDGSYTNGPDILGRKRSEWVEDTLGNQILFNIDDIERDLLKNKENNEPRSEYVGGLIQGYLNDGILRIGKMEYRRSGNRTSDNEATKETDYVLFRVKDMDEVKFKL